ncbi:nuclear transport factor 2 family protein [Curtobacterium sp. MCLR17_054]|uniref:nuclear transport factor 2 family protein n=1 Tax=Curtobacterium sp. MCLR17_054 TaxID=2175632 RepID=UPI000DA6E21D|nr:nuclear transport factor 2 family protein [Curtobacterium sp. MCLR17_054]WIE69952.1 nuclear transport factor 2 family protein [Curtobacterium sp. MCLR17_054]
MAAPVAIAVSLVAGPAVAAPLHTSTSSSTSVTTATSAHHTVDRAARTTSGGTAVSRLDRRAEQRNEATVRHLFRCAFRSPASAKARAAARTAVATGAVAHGATSASGPSALLAEFTADRSRVPGAHAVIKHIAGDADLVAVHWQITAKPKDERTGDAAVDLFRMRNGRISEWWALRQTVPTGTPASGNTNSMFSDLYPAAKRDRHLTERQEEHNRVLAVTAYDRLFRDHDVSVLDEKFDPAYLQHNSVAANGTAALKQFFAGSAAQSLPKQESVISLADGDLVWTFSKPVGARADAPFGAADLFRVDHNLIREHWDVVPTS